MIQEKVTKTIQNNSLLKKGDSFVIGVSGGPDSVCLLSILDSLKDDSQIKLVVAHVNYNLRGEDSKKDQELVVKLCEKKGLELFSKEYESNNETESNLEAALREFRYNFFKEVLEQTGSQRIAIAHNADDQVETFLMFLIRGAGMRGLTAMEYQTGNIIRPLLDCSRAEIISYLTTNNIKYREDASNADTKFVRNRIRHELIPYIKKNYNPELNKTVLKNIALIRDDFSLIQSVAASRLSDIVIKQSPDRFELNLKQWKEQPSSLKREMLRELIIKMKGNLVDVTGTHLSEIMKVLDFSEGKKYKSFWGLKFTKERGKIVISKVKV